MLRLLRNWLPAAGSVAFFTTSHYWLGAAATAMYLASVLSAWLMQIAARDNARFRVYVQAKSQPSEPQLGSQGSSRLRSLMRNNPEMMASMERIEEADQLEKEPGFVNLCEFLRQDPSFIYSTPEVQDRLNVIPISMTRGDIEQVSDRLALINMCTTLVAIALGIWGIGLWLW